MNNLSRFEYNYKKLVKRVLTQGENTQTRNGGTRSLFGIQLKIDLLRLNHFPLLTGRQIFYKGVAGEMAAFLKGPKSISDFKKQGCNYWEEWSDDNGNIKVDYGNKWINFNGVDQINNLISNLIKDPLDRRLLVSGWDPSSKNLSLPCCHYAYQFRLVDGKIDIVWVQRSLDVMIGLPSDIILAALFLILVCNTTCYEPGSIIMQFGDTHIYENHVDQAYAYLKTATHEPPTYKLRSIINNFNGKDLEILNYVHEPQINFKLNV